MITVDGAMNVSGGEGESPLRELAAVGGTPSSTSRHFNVPAGQKLYLSYVKLTGGSTNGNGGSILITGVGALASFTNCELLSNTAAPILQSASLL